MDFDQTLDEHLRAIRDRDFEAFAATVARDGVVLITAEGEFITDAEAFLQRHRDWFSMPEWSLETQLRHKRESGDLATCVLELSYREGMSKSEAPQRSLLSLVFAHNDGRWLMVQDQNTPITN